MRTGKPIVDKEGETWAMEDTWGANKTQDRTQH